MSWVLDELERAAQDFKEIPVWLRPVVTSEDALISGSRD